MKRGYSSVNFLIGFLISFFIINLLTGTFNILKKVNLKENNNDILAALQLYQIFNISKDILVFENEITFNHLDQEKTLSFVNNKLIIQPGTVIYFLNVDDIMFTLQDNYIYLDIKRKLKTSRYLIGESYE